MIVYVLNRPTVKTTASKYLMTLLIVSLFVAIGLVIFFFQRYTKSRNLPPQQIPSPTPTPDTSTSPPPTTNAGNGTITPAPVPISPPDNKRVINFDLIGIVLSGTVLLVLLVLVVVGGYFMRKVKQTEDVEKLLLKYETQLSKVKQLEEKSKRLEAQRQEEVQRGLMDKMKSTQTLIGSNKLLQQERQHAKDERARLLKMASNLRNTLRSIKESNQDSLDIIKMYKSVTKKKATIDDHEAFIEAVRGRINEQQKIINGPSPPPVQENLPR